MAYEQKDNTGSLWANDKKTSDKHPDRSGSGAKIDGVDYWVAGWIKKTDDGTPWLSLSFMPKDERKTAKKSLANDDIPF